MTDNMKIEQKSKGRKAKETNSNLFCNRLNILYGEKGETQENTAQALDTTRQAFGNWLAGRNEPDFDMTIKIANHYGVSVDYLFGLSDEKTTNLTAKSAIKYTGLSEKAVEALHAAIDLKPYMPLVLSFLIESDEAVFTDGRISGTFRALAFALWESFIKYPLEKRIDENGATFENMVDVQGIVSNQQTAIPANIYADAVFAQIIAKLSKLRDQETSENPSEYKEKFIDTVKREASGK